MQIAVTDSSHTPTPLLSVVMPTHRREHMLRRALESLQRQTLPPEQFEIIVVATEGDIAYSVVNDFLPQSRLNLRCVTLPNDPTHGRSASAKRNYGVSLSRGQWIAFIDDDCTASENWLAAASDFFNQPRVGAVEGRKEIPRPDRDTMVYRGLLLLTRPRGFQTCNMFYRRDVFDQVGGFDANFPYYLEDSDLAWSALDAGYEIPFAENAVVYHPVPPPHPWKMLADAKRADLMAYLFKKHPQRYRESNVKVLRWSHWIYIALYISIIAFAIARLWWAAAAAALLVLAFIALHSFKLFRGCATTPNEWGVTTLLLPACPVIKWVQLLRGNLKHGVWLWT